MTLAIPIVYLSPTSAAAPLAPTSAAAPLGYLAPTSAAAPLGYLAPTSVAHLTPRLLISYSEVVVCGFGAVSYGLKSELSF